MSPADAKKLMEIVERLRSAPGEALARGQAFADNWPGDHPLLGRQELVAIGERTYLVGFYTAIAAELEAVVGVRARRIA